ncbi:MAG: DUF6531 domain-containing protein [Parabacteroides sp.]|nr:DUF6531 domain-containing protein [Parabacteroides sp.]
MFTKRRQNPYLILMILCIIIDLFLIYAGEADSLTIGGSTQMSTGEIQTFTASGGTGEYAWSIAAGGGIITPDGAYTSPSSNPNCELNPKICVQDSTGQQECMQVAVNAYGTNQGGALLCIDYGKEYDVGQPGKCAAGIMMRRFDCSGNEGPIQAQCFGGSYGEYTCGDPVLDRILSFCGAPCSPSTADYRQPYQKAAGCCPSQLVGSSGSGSGNGTNDKGNPKDSNDPCNRQAPTVPAGSNANLKTGNLYHDQQLGILSLSYNSIDTYDGPVGKKWTHNYDLKLTILTGNTTLILKTEDGNVIYFHLSGTIYYPEAISGDTSRIVKNANNTYTRTLKNGEIQQYSTTGLLTSITDRNCNATTLTYSGSNLVSIVDKNNRTTTITTTNGKITAITDPLGRAYSLAYTNGLIDTATDPLGNAWHYTYATEGRMLTKVDPLNNTITYTYDTNGKLLTSTDPLGKTRTMNYNQTGTTTFTEKDGGVWTYTYDPTFTVKTSQTDPLGNITRYAYDLKRNLTRITYPDNTTTTYTYDAMNNMTSETDPLGKTTIYTYNSLNLVTSVTDPKGNITQYGYDTSGNLTSVTDALNKTTTYQYDSRGNITSITNLLGKTTTMTYDQYNNLRTVTDPKGGVVNMTYDSVGNMLTQTDTSGKVTTFIYNNLNQLTQVTDPKGYITQYTYDYKGNRLSTADANNNATWYTYDYKGQLTRITDALNNKTDMAYGTTGCSSCSGVDKLTSITDAKNQTTTYEYDLRGKLIKETDPLGKITTYTYDNKGNRTSITTPDNKTIIYSYDFNNRLIQKQYTDNTVTQFQYDDAGNMIYAGNQNIAYSYAYDANNRITQITDNTGKTIQYTYDAAGNRATMITPDNRTVTYSYDNNNLPNQITTNLGNFTFAYDINNRRITRTLPNGITTNYTYEDNGRLTGITTTKNTTSSIDTVTYTHDGAGNRLTKEQPQQNISTAYTYDNIYRLTQATPSGGSYLSEAYTYDQVGNRLTTINEQAPTDNETNTYSYDDENRLIRVQITQNKKTRELTFAYDPFGRRISKTITQDEIGNLCTNNTCPRTTTYVYDNQNIILEYDNSSNIKTIYTHGPNIDEPLSIEIKGTITFTSYYYHADGLGSITALTDASGNVTQRYEYDSFGNQTVTINGNITQSFTYTAREYDVETSLYFYRARYYDSKVGRFVTKDPISFAGGEVNLYGYVENNPVNYADPWGLAKLNLFNKVTDYGRWAAAENTPDRGDGYLDLYGHGTNQTFVGMDAWKLNKYIQSLNILKDGMSIFFNSCKAGEGNNSIAEQMARFNPGRDVYAAGTGVFNVNIFGNTFWIPFLNIDLGKGRGIPYWPDIYKRFKK